VSSPFDAMRLGQSSPLPRPGMLPLSPSNRSLKCQGVGGMPCQIWTASTGTEERISLIRPYLATTVRSPTSQKRGLIGHRMNPVRVE
jgi:hypothetical protein